jgi:hypothetical protein
MIDINRENYREYDAINYSMLSQLDKNPSGVQDEDREWTDGMAFGTLVDYMCFEPSKVQEEFYVSEADREPSKTAKKLADWMLNRYDLHVDSNGDVGPDPLDDLLEEAEEAVGSSTSFERYGGVDYLKEQIESQDKHIINPDLYNKARDATITLKTHPFTKHYFISTNKEVQFQVPIVWDPSEWDDDIKWMAKSLLDIVLIDHEEGTVTPVDLKTTSRSVYKFPNAFLRWRYYLQASYYWHGLYQRVKSHDEISDYVVKPFEFVVISQKDVQHPLVYTTTENTLLKGRDGGHLERWNTDVRGWTQLIKDLKWHEKEGKWNYSREIYENNGQIELDVFQ